MASTPRAESLAVQPRSVDGSQIVAADALDVLLHIHHAAGPFPVDARDEHAEIVGKVAGEALRVAGLHGEIELALERAAQLADHLDGAVAPQLGPFLLDQKGEMLEDPQVGVDLCDDTGTANLQDDRRAVGELGPMHLRDGGGGVRLAIEIDEHGERRPAERLLDLRQELLEWHRGHAAVQPAELFDPSRGEKVLSGREHLTQLDEGRPELLQRESYALRQLEMRD